MSASVRTGPLGQGLQGRGRRPVSQSLPWHRFYSLRLRRPNRYFQRAAPGSGFCHWVSPSLWLQCCSPLRSTSLGRDDWQLRRSLKSTSFVVSFAARRPNANHAMGDLEAWATRQAQHLGHPPPLEEQHRHGRTEAMVPGGEEQRPGFVTIQRHGLGIGDPQRLHPGHTVRPEPVIRGHFAEIDQGLTCHAPGVARSIARPSRGHARPAAFEPSRPASLNWRNRSDRSAQGRPTRLRDAEIS